MELNQAVVHAVRAASPTLLYCERTHYRPQTSMQAEYDVIWCEIQYAEGGIWCLLFIV